jgi:NADPH-dependent glutamate synthase beta subunit-like oxidoreductase
VRAGLPARSRRGAQAEKPEPVAICRLKRVTADYKDDIGNLLPRIVSAKNGKRIVCVGAGPRR